MHVHELMTHAPAVCTTSDHLTRAAQIMWERDCGSVPVIDANGQLAGIVTDRDLCMAAYTQGRAFHEIRIADVMSKVVFTVGPDSLAADALELLNKKTVRRLPVVDAKGRLLGMLSLADFVRATRKGLLKKPLNEAAIFAAFASVSAARPSQPKAPLPQSNASNVSGKGLFAGTGTQPASSSPSGTAATSGTTAQKSTESAKTAPAKLGKKR